MADGTATHTPRKLRLDNVDGNGRLSGEDVLKGLTRGLHYKIVSFSSQHKVKLEGPMGQTVLVWNREKNYSDKAREYLSRATGMDIHELLLVINRVVRT